MVFKVTIKEPAQITTKTVTKTKFLSCFDYKESEVAKIMQNNKGPHKSPIK